MVCLPPFSLYITFFGGSKSPPYDFLLSVMSLRGRLLWLKPRGCFISKNEKGEDAKKTASSL